MKALSLVWGFALRYPLVLAAILIAVQCTFALDNRFFWFSDEVRYAEAYSNLARDGHWIVLRLNGVAYPDKPPLYFLLLAALDLIPAIDLPEVMLLGSAVSGWLLLAGLMSLGRAMGFSLEARAAANLVMLSLFSFAMLLHYVRMDLLFIALTLWSLAALYRHYLNASSTQNAYLGFALAGLAVLTKGPLGLLFPLAAIIVIALFRGKAKSLLTLTSLKGFGVALAVVALWLVGIIAKEGVDFLMNDIIGKQVVARATDTFHHKEPVSYYFKILPIALLPWLGYLVAINRKTLANTPSRIAAARTEGSPKLEALIIGLVIFAVLSSLDGKVGVYILPVLALLALVFGQSIVKSASTRGFIGVAASLILLALAVASLALQNAGPLLWLMSPISAAILVVLGFLVWTNRSIDGAHLTTLVGLGMTVWSAFTGAFLLPQLNERLSPQPYAAILGEYAANGFTPIAYKTYPGIFSYYAGLDVEQVEDQATLEALNASGTIVIATRLADWESLGLSDFEILHQNEIDGGGGVYLVAIEKSE